MVSGGYCGFLLSVLKFPMFWLSITCNDTVMILWLAIANIKLMYLYFAYTPH